MAQRDENDGMLNRFRQGNLLPIAAVITWAAVCGFAFDIVWRRTGSEQALQVVLPLALLNFAAMWLAMDERGGSLLRVHVSLALQWLSALWLAWLVPLSFLPILTVVWISMVGGIYSIATTRWLLLATLLAWYGVIRVGWQEDGAILMVLLNGTFHLFALLSTHNAKLAETARDEVEALNRELLATQQLLSQTSRQQERIRIARDLHDLLGHHLTALSINLQIAEHLTDGEARKKVSESRALARLLLSDVREAVSTLREAPSVDFKSAIRMLIDNVPLLDIELTIGPDLTVNDVEVAEGLLRCIQEAITNTLRHAEASRLWIELQKSHDNIQLSIRDNGRAISPIQPGNGIVGVRERFRQLGGNVDFAVCGHSLKITASLPGDYP